MVSLQHIEATFAESTSDGVLAFLTLSSPELPQTIRVVNDNAETIISNGETFAGFSFSISLPSQTEGGTNRARLQVDNVSREIGAAIAAVTEPIDVLIEVARLEDPDSIEYSWEGFSLKNTRVDVSTVTGDLEPERINFPFPNGRFNATQFPGLGRGG